MSLPEQATRAAILKALVDIVKAESDGARDILAETLTELGAASVKANVGGQHVATVSMAGGKATARVVDESAFLAWVQQNHPSEVESRVREPYRRVLLDAMTKAAAPVTADGEVIPGVEMTNGSPYLSQRFTPTGREVVAGEWRAGRIDLKELA